MNFREAFQKRSCEPIGARTKKTILNGTSCLVARDLRAAREDSNWRFVPLTYLLTGWFWLISGPELTLEELEGAIREGENRARKEL